MGTEKKGSQGFASMSLEEKQRVSRLGGLAVHAKGTGHEWKTEEAREAGRKGGLACHVNRRLKKLSSCSGSGSGV